VRGVFVPILLFLRRVSIFRVSRSVLPARMCSAKQYNITVVTLQTYASVNVPFRQT
jgi:hypothetical protein